MKIIPLYISALALSAMLCCIHGAHAQSITINSVSGTSFCVGDPVNVNFTVTGLWGHNNAFTLQLSDPKGGFSGGFQNIGSLVDSVPGTFTISTTVPSSVSASGQYRVRILAAYPYLLSKDNGTDLSVGSVPEPFQFSTHGGYTIGGSVGSPVNFFAVSGDYNTDPDANDTAFWDFGPGATPQTATIVGYNVHSTGGFSQDATYSSVGDKTVSLKVSKPGGCRGNTFTSQIHIYDCTNPTIPHDAIVIDSNGVPSLSAKGYWVNPGFTFSPSDGDTVFAEPGSAITLSSRQRSHNCLIYLKHGAAYSAPESSSNAVIYADGTSVTTQSGVNLILSCPNLDFDYTNAPPNKIVTSGVLEDSPTSGITLAPNPATGWVSIKGLPSGDVNVSVMNILGETIIEQQDVRGPECALDLSKLAPGAYYARINSGRSVVTKVIIKH